MSRRQVCLAVNYTVCTNLWVVAAFPNVVYASDLLLTNSAIINLKHFHFLLFVQTIFVYSNDRLYTSQQNTSATYKTPFGFYLRN